MKIFPAIDIRDGKVVRLTHGDFNKEVRYELTPMEAAVQFAEAGAKKPPYCGFGRREKMTACLTSTS